MKATFAFAIGACALLATGSASAAERAGHGAHRRHLPPVSGTIQLDREAFGSGALPARGHRARSPSRAYLLPDRGLGWDAGRRPARRFAVVQPTFAPEIVRRSGAYRGPAAGFAGSSYAGVTTGWGTADSATTGGAYPLPSPRYHAEVPVAVATGEPAAFYDGYRGNGYAPTGGLSYYNSGSPGRMAYYGSSSSAGPYGTPGGLGIYSSGSFGPGPSVVHVSAHGIRRHEAGGCACGPRIIHVGGGTAGY